MSETPEHSGTLEEILRRRRRRTVRNIGLAILLLGVAGAAWFGLGGPAEPPPAPPTPVSTPIPPPPPEPAAKATPPATPEPQPPKPPQPEPMPNLGDSDTFVRQLVGALSSRPEWMVWLASDELIRRLVTSVDNLAEGRSPRDQLDSMWPEQKFEVLGNDDELMIDPESFARYDTLTDIVVALDSRSAASAYARLRPLIDEAYRELGYPDRPFDDTLQSAISELLATPVIIGEVRLIPRVISYAYADPELEGLSAAQKQLLRLGPVNAPRIQRKLREVAAALGIPASALPQTPIYQSETPMN